MSRRQQLFIWIPLVLIVVLLATILILKRQNNRGWQRDDQMLRYESDIVEQMVSDGQGGLWLATQFNGLNHF